MFVDWKDATCYFPAVVFKGEACPLRFTPTASIAEAERIARTEATRARSMGCTVSAWVEPSTWEERQHHTRYDDTHTPLYRFAINADQV